MGGQDVLNLPCVRGRSVVDGQSDEFGSRRDVEENVRPATLKSADENRGWSVDNQGEQEEKGEANCEEDGEEVGHWRG